MKAKRVASIVQASAWNGTGASDVVVLDAQDRHRRRVVLAGEKGASYLLDLPQPALLRDGDGLLLEDGTLVRVSGKPEPLVQVAAGSALDCVRLAWHLGNRHTDVQIVGDVIRIRRDHVLEGMLRGLGATLTALDAPFDPEAGAPHGHEHEHGG